MAGSVKDLSKYRFERCSEELENSKILYFLRYKFHLFLYELKIKIAIFKKSPGGFHSSGTTNL